MNWNLGQGARWAWTLMLLGLTLLPATGWENDKGLRFELPEGWVVLDQFPVVAVANSESSLKHDGLIGDDLFLTVYVEEYKDEPRARAEAAAQDDPENSRIYEVGAGWAVEGHDEDYAGVHIFLSFGETQVDLRAHAFRRHWPKYREAVLALSQTLSYERIPPPPKPSYRNGELEFEYYEGWQVRAEGDLISLSNAETLPVPGQLLPDTWLVQVRLQEGEARDEPYQSCIAAFEKQYPGAQHLDGGRYHTGAYVVGAHRGDLIEYYQLHPAPNTRVIVTAFKPAASQWQGTSFGGLKESLRFRGQLVFEKN